MDLNMNMMAMRQGAFGQPQLHPFEPGFYTAVPPHFVQGPMHGGPQPGPELNPDDFSEASHMTLHGHVPHSGPMAFDPAQTYQPYTMGDSTINFLGIEGQSNSEDLYMAREQFPPVAHEGPMWSIAEEDEVNELGASRTEASNPASKDATAGGATRAPDGPTAFDEFEHTTDFGQFLVPGAFMDDASDPHFFPQSWEQSAMAHDVHQGQSFDFPLAMGQQQAMPFRPMPSSGPNGSTLGFNAFHHANGFNPHQPVVPSQLEHNSRQGEQPPPVPRSDSKVDSAVDQNSPQDKLAAPQPRRESSASSLATGVGSLEVQSAAAEQTTAKPMLAGSGMSSRRQGRPAPIRTNSSGLRSTSFTSASPRAMHSNENMHGSLRKARSTVTLNSAKVQKPGRTSQRSPMTANFRDADIPKMTSRSMSNLHSARSWRQDGSVPMTPSSPYFDDGRMGSADDEDVVPASNMPVNTQAKFNQASSRPEPSMFFSHAPLPGQSSHEPSYSPPETPLMNMGGFPNGSFQGTPSSQMANMSMPSAPHGWHPSPGHTGPSAQYIVQGPDGWMKMDDAVSPNVVPASLPMSATNSSQGHRPSLSQPQFVNGMPMYTYSNMSAPMLQGPPLTTGGPPEGSMYVPKSRQPKGQGEPRSSPSQQSLQGQRSEQQQQGGDSQPLKPPSRFMTTWDSNASASRGPSSPNKPAFHFQSWQPSESHKVTPDKMPPRSRDGSSSYPSEITFHNQTPNSLSAALSPVRS